MCHSWRLKVTDALKDGRPRFVYFEETINSCSSLSVTKIIQRWSPLLSVILLACGAFVVTILKRAMLINFVFMWASVWGVFCMCSWDMKHGWWQLLGSHGTQHSARSTQHKAWSTRHTMRRTLHTAHGTQHTATRSTLHTTRSTQHRARSKKHRAQSTWQRLQCYCCRLRGHGKRREGLLVTASRGSKSNQKKDLL